MESSPLIKAINNNMAYSDRISELIKTVVCNYYNLPISVYESKLRKRVNIKTKQTTVYFIKKILATSTLAYIGKQTNYNHATVLHCLKTIEDLLITDKETKTDIENLENILHFEQSNLVLSKDISDMYYYISLDNCRSIQMGDKAIVLTGYSDIEAEDFYERNGIELVKQKLHENTKLFILEKKLNKTTDYRIINL